jgi:hypothetical protein
MSTLCRAKLGWQGNQTERIRGSHSSPEHFRGSPDDFFCRFHFSARLILLPSIRQAGLPRHSRLKAGLPRRSPDFRGEGGSHRVAVSRSDFVKGPVKIYEPFVPFRGHSVNVNPRDRFGFQTVKPMSGFDSLSRRSFSEGGSLNPTVILFTNTLT